MPKKRVCMTCGKEAGMFSGGYTTADNQYLCLECGKQLSLGNDPRIQHTAAEVKRANPQEPNVIGATYLSKADGKKAFKDFAATKKIGNVLKYNEYTGNIAVDTMQPVLKSAKKFFNISDVKSYEIICNDQSVGSFGVGRAIGGAILTGGIGLLAGFTKTNNVVSKMVFRIRTGIPGETFIDITPISTSTKTSSIVFQTWDKLFDQMAAFFEEHIIAGGLDTTSSEKTAVEQVKELKELLDLGILSQEEFDTKKKTLLGL